MSAVVLVTGGAGYIGSHACKALAAAGYRPVAYDNLVHGHDWAVRWGPLEVGDVADRACLDRVIDRYRPAAVMHFAAYAYVGESVAAPAKYYRNNVCATLTLLEAMADHGVDRLVFSSSCATYGVPRAPLLAETHEQRPINPYGASKLMAERMLADFATAHGLRSLALRYFNAAGADPDGEIGEAHDPETHLIPLVLAAAAAPAQGEGVTVFGTDYDTPDGTCVRDYLHVCDIARAHVLALTALADAARPPAAGAYNLGTGRGYSVYEIIAAARRVTGREVPVLLGPRRPGDPARLVADADKIGRELGWRPRHSALDDILASAWRWLRSGTARPGDG